MACTHLAAAGASSPAATAVRSPAHSRAAAFARLRSTPCFASAGLSIKGNRAAAFPLVAAAGPAAAAPVADLDGRPAAEKQSIIVIDNYDSFTYNLCQRRQANDGITLR